MCLIEMGMPKMGADRKPELDADGKPVINWIPRPQISCAQDVAEGMGVRTDSLDDAGMPQGRAWSFCSSTIRSTAPSATRPANAGCRSSASSTARSSSRFLEEKVHKPKHVDLGPRIVLDDERCILCSRCIRFTKEIAHDDALGFVDRGSYSTLTAHPGKPFDNNYTLNTVDICPVGALTSQGFPLQDARLVPQGNQQLLHELRHRLQHGHRCARGSGLPPNPAREQRRKLVVDVRSRPA